MSRLIRAAAIAAACLALAPSAFAQSPAEEARFDAAQQRFNNELGIFRQEFDRYQQARERDTRYRGPQGYNRQPSRYSDDRYENGYDPARDYRDGAQYRERTLADDDRVYRGTDGRYYCKRSDGTTGLVLGAAGGGILGNVIDGGHSRTVGTLIGGALGALAGRAVEQNNSEVRCR
jgi:hypothetical protein